MEEQASFEARAVLAPRRARRARFALLVPVVALIGIAWAGSNGPTADTTAVASPGPTIVATPSPRVEAPYPEQVIGLPVHRLGELQLGRLAFDDVVALAGWYVPMAITECPALPALYQDGSLPYLRGDKDKLAFCVRSGVLYASRPGAGSSGIAVTVVRGVIMPLELETVGSGPTEVVIVGRFSRSSEGCRTGVGCSRELEVDHVAWTPGA